MTAIRDLQLVNVASVGGEVNVPSCRSFRLSLDRGQDSLACAKCSLYRNLLYMDRLAFIDSREHLLIFYDIYDRFPFIEYGTVLCGKNDPKTPPAVVYLRQKLEYDPDLLKEKIREQFLFWKEARVGCRKLQMSQIFQRVNFFPVALPAMGTIRYDKYGDDQGVRFSIDRKFIEIVDFEKVFASGKYMYLVNAHQMAVLFGLSKESDPIPVF